MSENNSVGFITWPEIFLNWDAVVSIALHSGIIFTYKCILEKK